MRAISRHAWHRRALPALLLLANGCSWVFVQGPPSDPYRDWPTKMECTESRLAPVVDSFVAAAFLAFGIYALTDESRCMEQHEGWCKLDFLVAGGAGLIAVPFIASSIHGWTATGQCVAAKNFYAGEESHVPCRTGVERACVSVRDP